MVTSTIKTKALTKIYKMGDTPVKALDHVDFEVTQGELVALTGSSGSGKSTLMNILGCLDYPDEGNYLLNGEDVSQLDSDRLAAIRNRSIGFVFQTFNLLSRTTALENVELPLLYGGMQNSRYIAEEALRKVGLADRMHHEPNQMSGGQRQRVAIARAIVTDPAIILADEPTGNLDTQTSLEIMDLLMALHHEGRTIVIVTHEPDIAAYCQRQIRMQDGKILEITNSGKS